MTTSPEPQSLASSVEQHAVARELRDHLVEATNRTPKSEVLCPVGIGIREAMIATALARAGSGERVAIVVPAVLQRAAVDRLAAHERARIDVLTVEKMAAGHPVPEAAQIFMEIGDLGPKTQAGLERCFETNPKSTYQVRNLRDSAKLHQFLRANGFGTSLFKLDVAEGQISVNYHSPTASGGAAATLG